MSLLLDLDYDNQQVTKYLHFFGLGWGVLPYQIVFTFDHGR
jgi:hypothetical protein